MTGEKPAGPDTPPPDDLHDFETDKARTDTRKEKRQ
jgi:hypothetical protein